tara:strand:+ start:1377 stop:1538 length:162 start_codon:yes stop_codon:yes gene_type:complete
MSRLLTDIKHCEDCGCKTNELYLTPDGEILCADCEADYNEEVIKKINGHNGEE